MSGFETRAIHVGQEPDAATGAVVPPLHLTTTFAQISAGELIGPYDYGRAGTPTRTSLEAVINSLENAAYGYVFGSGLAAEDVVLRLVGPTDHVLIPLDAYGGTFRLIDKVHKPHGLQYTPVDFHNIGALVSGWQDNTKLVWFETPTNPTLSVIDIEKIAAYAHSRGALVVVDNTFASPYLQNPLDLGADIVIHSATKYISGHSDVTAGYVGLNNAELAERVHFLQKAVGAILAPFDCYQAMRSLKTLAVRVERHCDNAEKISAFLASHPAVKDVLYPGHPSHPQHDIAIKQMNRFGGMVSFTLSAGEAAALQVVENTEVFTLAESLGAVESLIEHPGKMTHSSNAGTPLEVDPALVRLSVGIETADDLIDDLAQALSELNELDHQRRTITVAV